MGQKTHPVGFRLGIVKPWQSRWFATKDMPALLKEDELIRKYLKARLGHAAISEVHIDRRPGRNPHHPRGARQLPAAPRPDPAADQLRRAGCLVQPHQRRADALLRTHRLLPRTGGTGAEAAPGRQLPLTGLDPEAHTREMHVHHARALVFAAQD